MSRRTRPIAFGLLLVTAGCGAAYSEPEPARPPPRDAAPPTAAPTISLDGALARVDELHRRQGALRRAVSQLAAEPGPERNEQIQALRDRKDQMLVDLQRLESEMDRAASESSDEAAIMTAAVRQVHDVQLNEKLRYSRGTIEEWDVGSAVRLEEEIERNLAALRDLMASPR